MPIISSSTGASSSGSSISSSIGTGSPTSSGAGSPTSGGDPNTYVIVGAGQSNMQGYGLYPNPTFDGPRPGLKQYVIGDSHSQSQLYPNQIIDAVEPLEDGGTSYTIGPLVQLGKKYMDDSGLANLILIQSAIGDTSTNQWLSNGLLARSVGAISAVNATVPSMKIAMIVWVQGENDARQNPVAQDYYNRLVTIINTYRNTAPGCSPTMPFLIVGMVPEWIQYQGATATIVSDVHRSIPNYIPYTAYRSPPMGMPGCYSDSFMSLIHFSSTGQRINGQIFAEAYKVALLNTRPFMVPSHPSGVAMTKNQNNFIFSWTNTNATSYALIYRKYTPWVTNVCGDLEVTKPTIVPLTSNPQTVNLFTAGQLYQYDILAYSEGIHSSQRAQWYNFTA